MGGREYTRNKKQQNSLNKTKKNSKILPNLTSEQRQTICKTYSNVFNTFEDKIKPVDISQINEINKLFKIPFTPSKITAQDDFYSYINYRWIKETKLEKNQEYITQLDSFRLVQYKVYRELLEIVKEYTQENDTKLSQEISNFYKSQLKGSSLNQIKQYANDTLNMIDELRQNNNNLWKLLGIMNQNEIISWGVPFNFNLFPDNKNPTIYRCYIDPAKLTLIDINLYYDDGTDVAYKTNYKRHYFKYLNNLFEFVFGKNNGFNIKDIFDVEVQLVQLFECVGRKNDQNFHNVVTNKTAMDEYGFNWTEFSKSIGFEETPDFFITGDLNYLDCCTQLLKKEWSSEKWRTYWIYIYIRQLVRQNQDGYRVYFEFNGKFVNGQTSAVYDDLGPVFGLGYAFNTFLTNEYINRYENKQYIDYLKTMASDLKTVFTRIIQKNKWLQPKTKEYALLKFKHFKLIIGSPKLLREDPLLNYSDNDGWGNHLKISKWRNDKRTKLNGKHVVDIPLIDWSLTPPKFIGSQAYVVNASYTPSENSIYVPLGYIQKPFLDLDERGIEYNLAHLGFTLAHEMSHSLDDFGSKYDYKGRLYDWWTDKDKKHFTKIQNDVITQYETFAKYDGIKFDAAPSVGEDLADISGLAICREYLRDWQDKNSDIIPIRALSYQAFFVYFAYQQRQKINKKALESQLKTNPHPLDKYRTNVPLSRMGIFRTIYNIKKGDKMFWHSTNTIW
jgi:putative endopeptidase